jgi:hypothetical protein
LKIFEPFHFTDVREEQQEGSKKHGIRINQEEWTKTQAEPHRPREKSAGTEA